MTVMSLLDYLNCEIQQYHTFFFWPGLVILSFRLVCWHFLASNRGLCLDVWGTSRGCTSVCGPASWPSFYTWSLCLGLDAVSRWSRSLYFSLGAVIAVCCFSYRWPASPCVFQGCIWVRLMSCNVAPAGPWTWQVIFSWKLLPIHKAHL